VRESNALRNARALTLGGGAGLARDRIEPTLPLCLSLPEGRAEMSQPSRKVAADAPANADRAGASSRRRRARRRQHLRGLLEGWKQDLRNCWWIVDYNRQSLDAVVREGLWERYEQLFRISAGTW
jgi:hypothetical protein